MDGRVMWWDKHLPKSKISSSKSPKEQQPTKQQEELVLQMTS